MPGTETWECRLCGAEVGRSTLYSGDGIDTHLMAAHGLTREYCQGLEGRLHAAVDHADHSDNTLGWYDGEKLVCLSRSITERTADDPMRDDFYKLP